MCVTNNPYFHPIPKITLFGIHKFVFVFRTSSGRLHLIPDVGKIPLADATLIEEPTDSDREDDMEADTLSQRTYRSSLSVNEACTVGNRDFKILIESKTIARNCVHLVAPTAQDKEAWISDISQCIDNIHLHSMLSPSDDRASVGGLLLHENCTCCVFVCDVFCVTVIFCLCLVSFHSIKVSSIGHQVSVHSDPRLFTDDVDIRFSRTLNSCKLPQVRYATPERLLQRLTGKNSKYGLIDEDIGRIIRRSFFFRFTLFIN